MIDWPHTISYVVTHMFSFVASTTAPYLDFFINYLPKVLTFLFGGWREEVRWNTNSYDWLTTYKFVCGNSHVSIPRNTLLLYPSLSPYTQTDWRTDRQTESQINPGCAGGTLTGSSRLTLFYSIPLLALTHRQTDRQTDRETNTLASRGLEEPAHASPGLEELFLQLCCCVSFLFWQGIGFGFTYYLCT